MTRRPEPSPGHADASAQAAPEAPIDNTAPVAMDAPACAQPRGCAGAGAPPSRLHLIAGGGKTPDDAVTVELGTRQMVHQGG